MVRRESDRCRVDFVYDVCETQIKTNISHVIDLLFFLVLNVLLNPLEFSFADLSIYIENC